MEANRHLRNMRGLTVSNVTEGKVGKYVTVISENNIIWGGEHKKINVS